MAFLFRRQSAGVVRAIVDGRRLHDFRDGGDMKREWLQGCVVTTLLLSSAAPAVANNAPMLDGFAIDVGFFASNLDANARVNGNVEHGTNVDFDRDLGIGGTSSLPFLSMSWRPFERHEFNFSYYEDDNSEDHALSRDITIRDNTYRAGTSISTKLSYTTYGAGYRYWAWIGDRAAFGVGLGFQGYNFKLKVKGEADITEPGGTLQTVADVGTSVSTTIPNPYIGLSYRYQAADWARFVADFGAFKANISDIDATLYNTRIGVEFYPWQNFGIVTQYMYSKIDADVSKSRFDGNAVFRFDGAQVLFRLRF